MTCKEFIEFLDDYFENRVTQEERGRFEEHLEICDDCRNYLDSYRITVHLGKAVLDPKNQLPAAMPPGIVAAILAARPKPSDA